MGQDINTHNTNIKQHQSMQVCKASSLRQKPQHILKRASLKPVKPTTTPARTMAFFQRNFYTPESSFTPLFRLLDDFDNYSRQGDGSQQHSRRGLSHWQPKFDVRETKDTYELHGELPGMNKNDIDIEFTDPQTMFIRGKVERTYSAGTPPAGQIEGITTSGVITEGQEQQQQPKASRQATVEDEPETASHDDTPTAGAAEEVAKKTPKQHADAAKYWLTERSIGEFSRSFNFPTLINQDTVTANFKDGILNIVVPKQAKHESRRIAIN